MIATSENQINEIFTQVLKENSNLFDVDAMDLLTNPDIANFKNELCIALNPYAVYFYDELNRQAQIPIGLLLGISKRFVEFSLKRVMTVYKYDNLEKIKEKFNKSTPEGLRAVLYSINNNDSVYIIYRNLKKTIDKEIV